MKNKEQVLYIAGAVILIAILYFGFDTKPSTQKALEKSRALNTEEFDIRSLEKEALPTLPAEESAAHEAMVSQVNHVTEDSQKTRLLKDISGFWYAHEQPILAGLYAMEVAKKENTAESWSIAGTTFASVLQQKELEEKKLVFARDKALEAFENAISQEPKVIEHRINQALTYIEAPLQDMPMKGIQMLAELAKTYPDSPLPPYHLARLAVRTNQFERAAERIEQALALDPTNSRFACLAVEIYKALDRATLVSKYEPVCALER